MTVRTLTDVGQTDTAECLLANMESHGNPDSRSQPELWVPGDIRNSGFPESP